MIVFPHLYVSLPRSSSISLSMSASLGTKEAEDDEGRGCAEPGCVEADAAAGAEEELDGPNAEAYVELVSLLVEALRDELESAASTEETSATQRPQHKRALRRLSRRTVGRRAVVLRKLRVLGWVGAHVLVELLHGGGPHRLGESSDLVRQTPTCSRKRRTHRLKKEKGTSGAQKRKPSGRSTHTPWRNRRACAASSRAMMSSFMTLCATMPAAFAAASAAMRRSWRGTRRIL